jgi:hypothetical protein
MAVANLGLNKKSKRSVVVQISSDQGAEIELDV